MSRTDPQFKLRVPQALRLQIEQAAHASRRSMNAEMVVRLEASFAKEQPLQEKTHDQ